MKLSYSLKQPGTEVVSASHPLASASRILSFHHFVFPSSEKMNILAIIVNLSLLRIQSSSVPCWHNDALSPSIGSKIQAVWQSANQAALAASSHISSIARIGNATITTSSQDA
jgi:hypothetical protein